MYVVPSCPRRPRPRLDLLLELCERACHLRACSLLRTRRQPSPRGRKHEEERVRGRTGLLFPLEDGGLSARPLEELLEAGQRVPQVAAHLVHHVERRHEDVSRARRVVADLVGEQGEDGRRGRPGRNVDGAAERAVRSDFVAERAVRAGTSVCSELGRDELLRLALQLG